jgi:hypothetical protein
VPTTVFRRPAEAGAGHANPNFATAAEGDGMNRKEKEAAEAKRKQEDYMRRHLAGETEEARKDLERLALVRKKREEDAAARLAQGRAPGWTANGVESDDDDDSSSDDSDDGKPKAPKAPKAAAAPAAAPALTAAQAKKKAAALEESPAASAPGGATEVTVLKSMDIKKMNGDALKDALKERGLEIQGAKKDLTKRLLDYEAARGGK